MTLESTPKTHLKEAALEYFWRCNSTSLIHEFWQSRLPDFLKKVQKSPAVPTENELTRLSGPVFENLALSYLITSNRNPNIIYLPSEKYFEEFKASLNTSPELHLSTVVRKNNFRSTRIQWQERYLTIPDGFCFSRNQDGELELASIIEVKTKYKQKDLNGSLESIWLFIEFIRQHPQIWSWFCQTMGLDKATIAEDKTFRFNLLHVENLLQKETDRLNQLGWTPREIPFQQQEIREITARLLQELGDQN